MSIRKIIKSICRFINKQPFIVPNSQDTIIPICRAITRYLTPLSNCRTDTHTGKVEIVYRQSDDREAEREKRAKRALRESDRRAREKEGENDREVGEER